MKLLTHKDLEFKFIKKSFDSYLLLPGRNSVGVNELNFITSVGTVLFMQADIFVGLTNYSSYKRTELDSIVNTLYTWVKN
jgi:hypothetical protein